MEDIIKQIYFGEYTPAEDRKASPGEQTLANRCDRLWRRLGDEDRASLDEITGMFAGLRDEEDAAAFEEGFCAGLRVALAVYA